MNTLELYGAIGPEISVREISEIMSKFGPSSGDLEALIYSPGGGVFEGIALYNLIRSYPGRKKAKIVGLSASMMTYVMLAFDEITMVDSAYMMIHNPRGVFSGDQNDLTKEADLLSKIADTMAEGYCQKTGLSKDVIKAMMDKETWMTAQEAKDFGFIDSIVEGEMKMVANIDLKYFSNAPTSVIQAFDKNNNPNPKKEGLITMKSDLLKILALAENATEPSIVSAVASLKADIQAKTDLISGLNSKIQDKDAQIVSLTTDIKAHKKAEILAEILESQNVIVSDVVKAKLESRIDAYLVEQNPDRLEDAKLYAKHFGAPKNSGNAPETKRTDFSSSVDNETKIVEKTRELVASNQQKYEGTDGYLLARNDAMKSLNLEK